jgi:hypothetical protein
VGRSFAVLAFIAAVYGTAIYVSQRPTIASGEVLGAQLTEANGKNVKEMHCDDHVPISASGAHFACEVLFKDGERARMVFDMDRAGAINQAGEKPHQKVKRTSDPWGD